MKKVFLITVLSAISFSGFSQDNEEKKIAISAGAEIGIPVGDFGDSYSLGIGATVQADYNISEKLALTLNTGYVSYSGKSISFLGQSIKNPALGIIPVLVGGKFSFSDNLYGSAQLGLSFWSAGDGVNGNDFTFAPGIGYKFSNIDVQLRYNSINTEGSSLNSLGFRVAYNF